MEKSKLFLKRENCDMVKSNTDKEDWDEKDFKAMNDIYTVISNK